MSIFSLGTLYFNRLTKNELAKIEGVTLPKYTTEKSSFKSAFVVLSTDKLLAISNIYTFCSYIDDIVDDPSADIVDKEQRLNFWRKQIETIYSKNTSSDLYKIATTLLKYKIPQEYVMALIDGLEADLSCNRYATLDELLHYCYGVASIVGLMCMYIFLCDGGEAIDVLPENMQNFAITLGYALQITNIIRDVEEDASRNYIYIPTELMKKHNVTEKQILENKKTENYNAMMQELCDFNLTLYDKVDTYVTPEIEPKILAALKMKEIYLEKLIKM